MQRRLLEVNFSTKIAHLHKQCTQESAVMQKWTYTSSKVIPAQSPSPCIHPTKVVNLAERGKLLLVLWGATPQHELWTLRYDHRIVHSHALLALAGLPASIMWVYVDAHVANTVVWQST